MIYISRSGSVLDDVTNPTIVHSFQHMDKYPCSRNGVINECGLCVLDSLQRSGTMGSVR